MNNYIQSNYNNYGKEPGRLKSCFRFHGIAKSKINRGQCNNGNHNKNLLHNHHNIPTKIRIADVLQRNGLGKNTHFGHDYVQQPRLTSYLGTVEGQPGGIGSPLRNKF
jgi:hypothetical protein